MGKRNGANRPWDEPGYRKTALAQLDRAIRAQENRVAQTTGAEHAQHQKALARLKEEWQNHTGEHHVR